VSPSLRVWTGFPQDACRLLTCPKGRQTQSVRRAGTRTGLCHKRRHERTNQDNRSSECDWKEMVGSWGLEPQTSTVSRWRSNQLSYEPSAVKSFSYANHILAHATVGAQIGSPLPELLVWQSPPALAVGLQDGNGRNAWPSSRQYSLTTQGSVQRLQTVYPAPKVWWPSSDGDRGSEAPRVGS
jgi:hypothetical protein